MSRVIAAKIAHSRNAPPRLIPLGRKEVTARNIIHIQADGVNLLDEPAASQNGGELSYTSDSRKTMASPRSTLMLGNRRN